MTLTAAVVQADPPLLLSPPPQETRTSNYEGTRTVLELAASAQCLRGLVHVSSAFVNMNVPRGSIIDEAIYPLRLGRQVVDVEQIAKVGCQKCWGTECGTDGASVLDSLPSCLCSLLYDQDNLVWCRPRHNDPTWRTVNAVAMGCCHPDLNCCFSTYQNAPCSPPIPCLHPNSSSPPRSC